ncbi:MAG: NUDIX domain-containing protein [Solirubrobacterales bacterium]|nr:NUDIX domain-containing protein [Solirubrobacterales bacterium]
MNLPVPLQRLGYRVAYNGLRVYWWVFRPHSSGVKCVLTHRDDVLLVRHTYGPRGWELPGGSRKRGEDAALTATREIQEELGLSIESWRPLGQIEVLVDHHRDSLHCFQAEVGSPESGSPDLVPDLGELAAVQWFPKAELPRPLGRYTLAILDRLNVLA